MASCGTSMPRKRKKLGAPKGAAPAKRRQYNVGIDPATAARIDDTAEALGLDASQLLRMIVREHLPEYERRAAATEPAAPKG